MRLSVLIADDEPHARRLLRTLLEKDKEVEIVYECKNGQEVLNFMRNKEPSILYLDINMPGINGVDVAKELQGSNTLVIFSTAYDEYALKAFELAAFDYLLKPFEESRFFDVLERAKHAIETKQQAHFSQKFAGLYQEYNNMLSPHLTEFTIKEKGFEKSVHISEVLFIEASSIYAVLHLINSKVLYRTALNLLEQQLPNNFIRIHRSFIVNKDYVNQIKYLNNNTYMFTMANQDVILSSRTYKAKIAEAMKP